MFQISMNALFVVAHLATAGEGGSSDDVSIPLLRGGGAGATAEPRPEAPARASPKRAADSPLPTESVMLRLGRSAGR